MSPAKSHVAIGVDLGGTTVKTGIVSRSGEILHQAKLPSRSEKGPEAVVGQIERSVKEALSKSTEYEVIGVGVGAPGIVSDDGIVKAPPNLKDWVEVPLGAELSSRLHINVAVENDANAAAIAESKFGAGKEYPDFLFVIWGTGVGGGIILNRKIFRGPTGGAGEIGHVSIDANGERCNCGGRGCVEAYVGQRYLSQRTRERLKGKGNSLIVKAAGGNADAIEPVHISTAAAQGDPLAQEMLREAGELLGVALASVLNVLDLRVSIIGGGISAVGDDVLRATEKSVRARVLSPLRSDVRVLRAELGNDAGILGAAGLVL